MPTATGPAVTPPAAPLAPTADPSKLIEGPGASFVPLDDPEVLAAEAATYLTGDSLVMGLTINGESRAYPLQMARYHHVINDVLGGKPVAVTY